MSGSINIPKIIIPKIINIAGMHDKSKIAPVRIVDTKKIAIVDTKKIEVIPISIVAREPVKKIAARTIEERYRQEKLEDQIYLRPDTYIGSINQDPDAETWTWDPISERVVYRSVFYVPAFHGLFNEVVVNAIDQHRRMNEFIERQEKIRTGLLPETPEVTLDMDLRPVTKIMVNVNQETGQISIENNGTGIQCVIHQQTNVYLPEMLFGLLLTGENYNEEDEKTWGGKNGYGAKLVNIFSESFTIETVDCTRELLYKQTWTSNMKERGPPEIKKYKRAPFTRITYTPEYKKFGITGETIQKVTSTKTTVSCTESDDSENDETTETMEYVNSRIDNDTFLLLQRRTMDIAACTDDNCLVYFNGVKVPTKTFEKYVNLYVGNCTETKRHYFSTGPRWEIVVCPSPNQEFTQVSFVNGIFTDIGGRHVDHVANTLSKKIADKINSSSKIKVQSSHVKNNLFIFVKSIIVNPNFDSQTKRHLTTNVAKFGSKCIISDEEVDKIISKLKLTEQIKRLAEFKNEKAGKRSDGKKSIKISGIVKLRDAQDAGHKSLSSKCILIITEGDSAKTTAEDGISALPKEQQRRIGVFPIRGKFINTRQALASSINTNAEVIAIKKILGLKDGIDYSIASNFNTLRYGRIRIMADADDDGIHIKGLLMNFFHHKYPGLLKGRNFIDTLVTPIIKIFKGSGRSKVPIKGTVHEFCSLAEFKDYVDTHGIDGYQIKYYKGLGTHSKQEAKEIVRKNLCVSYQWDLSDFYLSSEGIPTQIETPTKINPTDYYMNMAFQKNNINMCGKKMSDHRKKWILDFTKRPSTEPTHITSGSVTFGNFINNDVVYFSNCDTVRSIPSICDGLKPSQRKILFGAFKRSLYKEIKVSQLAGYISEHTGYHHGEASLEGTIVKMAQNYPGSNNLNIFYPSGQFGSRRLNGADHAQSRYIFTRLNDYTDILFNPTDTQLLKFLEDEGSQIEPEWYLPIIPMVLINGAAGIGTGFSTNISMYNPRDIINDIRHLISDFSYPLKPLIPWFRGYSGSILKVSDSKFEVRGVYTIKGDIVTITELPVGSNKCMSYEKYQLFIESLFQTQPRDTKHKHKLDGFIQDCEVLSANSKDDETSLKIFNIEFVPGGVSNFISQNTNSKENGRIVLEKALKLRLTVSTTNMYLYDQNGVIRKYDTTVDIIREYFEIRLVYYQKRKELMIQELKYKSGKASAKARFISDIISGKISVVRSGRPIPKSEWVTQLENSNPPFPLYGKNMSCDKLNYSYLINMALHSLTQETLDELLKEKDELINMLENLKEKTPGTLWNEDLDKLENQYASICQRWKEETDIQPEQMTILERDPCGSYVIDDKDKINIKINFL